MKYVKKVKVRLFKDISTQWGNYGKLVKIYGKRKNIIDL